MRRDLAFGGAARPVVGKGVSSVACLAFVVLLALAFWAGAVWLGQVLIHLSSGGF
ncbi:hypothetical protein [Phenylobacterium sp.]|uniref:hypothetical protein n=1 Tax=Phenylobacterium sp. TaxID=1871053 RepID=UPI002B7E4F99|nr:hypothetical protein [Phenylobacterium sp.]HVI31405.1 hypothetical protein [Phenylobacterium sp.]